MSSSDIVQAIRPLIQWLEQHSIGYYIGGSVASSAHGLPRTTIDVDIVVDLKPAHVGFLYQTYPTTGLFS